MASTIGIGGTLNYIDEAITIELDSIEKVTALLTAADVISGVTGTRTVTKEYRISTNGVYEGDWKTFSTANISAESINSDLPYFIQIRYTRGGTDSTGSIVWTSSTVTWTEDTGLDNSLKTKIIKTDSAVNTVNTSDGFWNKWVGNVISKLKDGQILPDFIEQTDDLIEFFTSIASFFAWRLQLIYNFANVYGVLPTLRGHLRVNRDMTLVGDEDLPTLQGFADNRLQIIGDRGTYAVETEFKRLINQDDSSYPYLWCELIQGEAGLRIGQSFPTNEAVTHIKHLNLLPREEHLEVTNLANYPYSTGALGDEVVSIASSETGIEGVVVNTLRYSQSPTTGVGAFFKIETPDLTANGFVVDTDLDYEISFKVKSNTRENTSLVFGVDIETLAAGVLTCKSLIDGSATNLFNSGLVFMTPSGGIEYFDDWLFIKAIIRRRGYPTSPNKSDNRIAFLKDSNQLVFPDSDKYVRIYPTIDFQYDNLSGAPLLIDMYDLRVAPASIQYTMGGLYNNQAIIISQYVNQSESLTDQQVTNIVNDKLISAHKSLVRLEQAPVTRIAEYLYALDFYWDANFNELNSTQRMGVEHTTIDQSYQAPSFLVPNTVGYLSYWGNQSSVGGAGINFLLDLQSTSHEIWMVVGVFANTLLAGYGAPLITIGADVENAESAQNGYALIVEDEGGGGTDLTLINETGVGTSDRYIAEGSSANGDYQDWNRGYPTLLRIVVTNDVTDNIKIYKNGQLTLDQDLTLSIDSTELALNDVATGLFVGIKSPTMLHGFCAIKADGHLTAQERLDLTDYLLSRYNIAGGQVDVRQRVIDND